MNIRTSTLFLLVCLFSLPLFALHPSQSASLWDHMTDVNVQWERQVQDQSIYKELVRFDDETERIRTHLSLVEGILRARPAEHLTEAQRNNRLRLLDHLRTYHQAGKFPLNHELKDRTPFFIDAHGTACAVGHLLIQDGQKDLALRIKQEMNNAYLLDMPYPEIPAWAEASGFTQEELAWIQPGYPFTASSAFPPAIPFPDERVEFLFNDEANGRLIIAGDFTTLAGVTANHVASWDGGSFSSIGGGLNGEIYCAIDYNGTLYFGGNFNQGANNLAKLNGTTWTFETVYTGVINTMVEWNGDLYIGGDLTHSGSALVQHILKHDNGNWISVGQGFDEPVHALTVHNGQLHAGGEFTMSGIDSTHYVAVWNGSNWDQVDNGLDARVLSLESDGTDLYAGGWIYNPPASSNRSFGLAKAGNGQWEELLPDSLGFDYHISGQAEISKIIFDQGFVYLNGNFACGTFFYFGLDLGYYSPGFPGISPYVSPDSRILDVEVFNNRMVLGGSFNNIHPYQISNLAAMSLLVNRIEPDLQAGLTVYPMPASSGLRVTLPPDAVEPQAVLYDLNGKIWPIDFQLSGNELVMDRGQLAAGIYMLRVMEGDRQLGVSKVVFQ